MVLLRDAFQKLLLLLVLEMYKINICHKVFLSLPCFGWFRIPTCVAMTWNESMTYLKSVDRAFEVAAFLVQNVGINHCSFHISMAE